jgi:hypothetical protein
VERFERLYDRRCRRLMECAARDIASVLRMASQGCRVQRRLAWDSYPGVEAKNRSGYSLQGEFEFSHCRLRHAVFVPLQPIVHGCVIR